MKLLTEIYGIDIGTSSIKLVNLEGNKEKGYKVLHAESIDLPPGLVGGGCTNPEITDLKAFSSALSVLVNKAGNPDKEVIVALPDRWVKLYLLDVMIPEKEVGNDAFLKWKLEKLMPMAEEVPTVIDYAVLDAEPLEKEVKLKIAAAGVHKNIIEILSGITAELKLEVLSFNTSTLGLINIYEDIYPDKVGGSPYLFVPQTKEEALTTKEDTNKYVINLHIGNETTVVKAYENGKLAYERVIEVAGDEFTKIISEIDQCDYSAALKTKLSEKFFPVNRSDVEMLNQKRGRFEKIFDNWLREINVTFSFFKRKFRIAQVPLVFITGGGSMFSGIDVFLSEFLQTQCVVFNPFNEIKALTNVSEELKKHGSVFAQCVGLLSM